MTRPTPQPTTTFEEEDEHEFNSQSDVPKAVQQWTTTSAAYFAQLHSPDRDTRIAAITSLTTILSSGFIGASLDNDRTDLFSRIFHLIRHPASPAEHNHALKFICIACLQRFEAFNPIATAFIREFLPTLSSVSADQAFRFYAIAFLASLSFTADDDRAFVLSRYCELFTNPSARGSHFTDEVHVECLKGICLMLACYPLYVSLGYAREIAAVVTAALASAHAATLTAALDLLVLLHACQYADETVAMAAPVPEDQFTEGFAAMLDSVPAQVTRKAAQRALAKQCARVRRAFEGAVESVNLVLAAQAVEIVGACHLTFVGAVRRLTGGYFGAQMTANEMIHKRLGIRLMTECRARQMKRKMREVILQNRIINKRSKEMEITKKRRQKDQREQDPHWTFE